MHHTHRSYNRKRFFNIGVFVILLCVFVGIFWSSLSKNNESPNQEVSGGSVSKPNKNEPQSRTKPYISILPEKVFQGEAVFMVVEGATTTESVKSFTYNGRPLFLFTHNGKVSALLGVDLQAIPGTYPLVLTFKDGKQIKEDLVIRERDVIKRPFDIPEKLGGNTLESERQLIATLAVEGKIINSIPVVYEKLWDEKFRLPLNIPLVVADDYGYTRIVGKYTTMPHKGTDIQAPMGATVYAMNRGVVKYVGDLRNYGSTIVIDHGAGLQTVYMHLSEINVALNQTVEKGDIIAKSGDSGYTLDPHLHLTIRIWDVSIDPIRFLEILGEGN